MPKYLSTLLISFLLLSHCFAQQNDTLTNKVALPNEWMVKFAPLSVFETDGGINFSGEYLVSRLKLGFQLEAQAVLFSLYRQNDTDGFDLPVGVVQSGPPHGIKLRPEVRYYLDGIALSKRLPRPGSRRYGLDPETRRRLQSRTYIALDFLYKNIHRQRINEFNVYNGGSQPVFRQRAVYTDVKQVTGFDFKLGVLGPTSGEHWLTDFYIGVGIRYKKFWYRNLPAGASEPARTPSSVGLFNTINTVNVSDSRSYASVPFGIKITYRF